MSGVCIRPKPLNLYDKQSRLFIQTTEIYSYCQDDIHKSSHVKINGQVQYYLHFYNIAQFASVHSNQAEKLQGSYVTVLTSNLLKNRYL